MFIFTFDYLKAKQYDKTASVSIEWLHPTNVADKFWMIINHIMTDSLHIYICAVFYKDIISNIFSCLWTEDVFMVSNMLHLTWTCSFLLSSVESAGPVLSFYCFLHSSASCGQTSPSCCLKEPSEVLLHGQRPQRQDDARPFLLGHSQQR